MVKRGSRYLRNALYLATNMAYLHSHVFRVYIDKKRSQGKHFYTAISHGIKKTFARYLRYSFAKLCLLRIALTDLTVNVLVWRLLPPILFTPKILYLFL